MYANCLRHWPNIKSALTKWFNVKYTILSGIALLARHKNQVKFMNTSTDHILQCNQSEPLADASGSIVDLMNENTPDELLQHWTNVSKHLGYTRCPCRDDIPPFNQWLAKIGKSRWRHRDGLLLLSRHSEAYTLSRKFNHLGLRLFKAFIHYAADAFLLFWCV